VHCNCNNTPYGYLDGTTVKLLVNTYRATNADIISNDDIAMSLFVRYFPGASVTFPRELINYRNAEGVTRLQLRQQSATETAAPTQAFSGLRNRGNDDNDRALVISKWYFFAIALHSLRAVEAKMPNALKGIKPGTASALAFSKVTNAQTGQTTLKAARLKLNRSMQRKTNEQQQL
jgi:hypothetical protein